MELRIVICLDPTTLDYVAGIFAERVSHRLDKLEEHIMSALDDAVTALQLAVTAAVNDINAQAAIIASGTDPTAAIASINAITSQLQAAVTPPASTSPTSPVGQVLADSAAAHPTLAAAASTVATVDPSAVAGTPPRAPAFTPAKG